MDRGRVIGRNGKIPWHCPTDLKRFKELTMGHYCIVGRKTYESLPPLPGRKLIVVTRQDYNAPLVARCFTEAVGLSGGEAFVIGGAEIYQLALPSVDRMYVTAMRGEHDGDTRFPVFNQEGWFVTHFESFPDHNYMIWEKACAESQQ